MCLGLHSKPRVQQPLCANGRSILTKAQDTILLPLRIATSPVLLRTYLRTILLFITSTILFGLAVVAYTSFYYSYIPVRGITVPVYLQFDHGSASPDTVHKSPYGVANVHGLVSRQKYHVTVEMTVPRSTTNLNAGNWMVGLWMYGPSASGGSVQSMQGWDDEWNLEEQSQDGAPGTVTQKSTAENSPVLARSRRPAILTYRSWPIEHAYRFLRLPVYLLGWHTESEHLEVSMFNWIEFGKGLRSVPSSVRVELRSKYPLEVYTLSVRFSAKLEGLRWLMYRYWLSSAIVGTCLFWSVEMGVLLFTWAIFTLLFGTSSTPSSHERIKPEPSETRREHDTEPGTPFSDTSRTFPTLPSQQPLHYTSSSPKIERQTPSLDDIPVKEEAEADDEDDDFVLEEPVPRNVEKEGVFTDSGIGTSLESSVERDRGLSRRKSGRRDGDR
jgi:seipin